MARPQPKANVARAAATAAEVQRRFAAAAWWQYRRLDREHRSRTFSIPSWFPDWPWITANDVEAIAQRAEQPVPIAGLLSMHPSGYVREAAVAVLATSCDPEALPFVVVRTVDWVEQVRTQAEAAIPRLIDAATSRQRLQVLALLRAIDADRSRPASPFTAELATALAAGLADRDLVEALEHQDVRVRRLAARQLVARGAAVGTLDLALEQGDIVTARIIASGALDDPRAGDQVLGTLLSCRLATLRALALHRYQSTEHPDAEQASRSSLLDRSPSVRSLAQRFLGARGIDVRVVYIEALPENVVALRGLAEVGAASDVARIEPYLRDRRPRARVAAVLALGRLLGPRAREPMLAMLADPEPSVIRAAGTVLARHQLGTTMLDELWDAASAVDASRALRRAAFRVFGQQGRWPKLVLACRAVSASDGALREPGLAMLDSVLASWNRSFTDPTAEQIDELNHLEPALRDLPGADVLHDLLGRYANRSR